MADQRNFKRGKTSPEADEFERIGDRNPKWHGTRINLTAGRRNLCGELKGKHRACVVINFPRCEIKRCQRTEMSKRADGLSRWSSTNRASIYFNDLCHVNCSLVRITKEQRGRAARIPATRVPFCLALAYKKSRTSDQRSANRDGSRMNRQRVAIRPYRRF